MLNAPRLTYHAVEGLLPKPAAFTAAQVIDFPAPSLDDQASLAFALTHRHSTRTFAQTPLSNTQLGNLLWSADGINRRETGGRTAPSANAHNEVDIYVALPEGVYRYESARHQLVLKKAHDARNLTGYQDFVGDAPLDIVYVVRTSTIMDMPAQQRDTFAAVAVGAIAQNVSLYCAATGLATVVRGWINHRLLADALSLNEDEMPVLAQTVGLPALHA